MAEIVDYYKYLCRLYRWYYGWHTFWSWQAISAGTSRAFSVPLTVWAASLVAAGRAYRALFRVPLGPPSASPRLAGGAGPV